jgi:DNA polymerase-3 subunit epsilon
MVSERDECDSARFGRGPTKMQRVAPKIYLGSCCAASWPARRYAPGSLMSHALTELPVLTLDCQASGASPAYGDVIELGWAVCAGSGPCGPVRSTWIVPRTQRPVPRAVRELTGWNEACVADAVVEQEAWMLLRKDAASVGVAQAATAVPSVIHYARFELPFLRDLHQRSGEPGDFPLDAVCVHAVAARLFPDLPRRNIRALAGFLGHSPELVRRSAGHVEATAFIWQKFVPLLEQRGVTTWSELHGWLAETPARRSSTRRVYPLLRERRRALPDAPGVYRFLRCNGDVLYVGKAASLRKRVASHHTSGGRSTERALELLSQVQDVAFTATPSVLEAALLECDEIKRLDPPYNVQLRAAERRAWFASDDLRQAEPVPDDTHRVGPLPSERCLLPRWALVALLDGAAPSPGLCAAALAVPARWRPEDALFLEGWQAFVADHLPESDAPAARRIERAARALWLERGRKEVHESPEDAEPLWDLARVRRRLERGLVQTGLLQRRARCLRLLADADVAYQERGMSRARLLVVSRGEIVEQRDLDCVAALRALPVRAALPPSQRRAVFDAASYDRLRVLLTELLRVREDGGAVALRIGAHGLPEERCGALLRLV